MGKIKPFADCLIEKLSLDPAQVPTRQQWIDMTFSFLHYLTDIDLSQSKLPKNYATFRRREATLRERVEDIVVDLPPPRRPLSYFIDLAIDHYYPQGFAISAVKGDRFAMTKGNLQYNASFALESGPPSYLFFTLFHELPGAYKKL